MPDIEPPLVDIKVSNPIVYIKKWWAKIIGNEGIDFRIHFHPLTAIATALAIASVGFGVGRFVMPFSLPFFRYEEVSPFPTPTPSPNNEIPKETAYIGTLRYSESTQKYYLVTTSSEAITLSVPQNIDLSPYIGKRILAAGFYSKSSRILVVSDAQDMELLPRNPSPIPTSQPTVDPNPEVTTTPINTPIPTPTQ